MSEEARDDDNASSEKGRDGIFMEHYHSRMEEGGGGLALCLSSPYCELRLPFPFIVQSCPLGRGNGWPN